MARTASTAFDGDGFSIDGAHVRRTAQRQLELSAPILLILALVAAFAAAPRFAGAPEASAHGRRPIVASIVKVAATPARTPVAAAAQPTPFD